MSGAGEALPSASNQTKGAGLAMEVDWQRKHCGKGQSNKGALMTNLIEP